MSIESGSHKPWPSRLREGEYVSPEDYPEIYQQSLDSIRIGMEGRGLDGDARNILNHLDLSRVSDISKLRPAEHYEEYLLRKDRFSNHAESRLIIELSDPQAIAEFDALIDELNGQVERIKEEKDVQTLENIITRGVEIFRKYNG